MQSKTSSKNTVVIFGVFDTLHDGHLYFLRQAAEVANKRKARLVAIVAPDSAVWELKGKMPVLPQYERMSAVRILPFIDDVILGDELQGIYAVLKSINPDCICVGYDQSALKRDIERCMREGIIPAIAIISLKPNLPELYKSARFAGIVKKQT